MGKKGIIAADGTGCGAATGGADIMGKKGIIETDGAGCWTGAAGADIIGKKGIIMEVDGAGCGRCCWAGMNGKPKLPWPAE